MRSAVQDRPRRGGGWGSGAARAAYADHVLRVGLTGGIGSGKSAVSELLGRAGAVVVDADLLAREVVAPGSPGLAAVVEVFGPEVLLADGSLDRPALGAKAFADDGARHALNAVLHPRIARRTQELVAAAEAAGAALLVHDAPLLVEHGLGPDYHLVVVVDAPVELRLSRLAGRGLTREQARARMAAQADDAARRAAADVWVGNAGTRQELAELVRSLHTGRLVPYAENLRARRPAQRGPVALVEPRDRWAADGARLVARLQKLCPGAVVEHTGSTAVPGLAAKDVVDLQVEVQDWGAVEAAEGPLGRGGFVRRADVTTDPVRPELDARPAAWRKHLHRSCDPGRPANVHVRVAGSTGARAQLAFRDLLRTDRAVRDAYAERKRVLAALHPDDVDAYAEGKTGFVVPLLGAGGELSQAARTVEQ